LTRISSEILKAFPGVPKPVEWSPELMPLRIADAFFENSDGGGADSPVMLVVDDIHAADNASIAIIHTVARKLNERSHTNSSRWSHPELRLSSAADALTSDETLLGLISCPLTCCLMKRRGPLSKKLGVASEQAELPVERILRAARGNPLAIELLTREWAAHGSTSLLKA